MYSKLEHNTNFPRRSISLSLSLCARNVIVSRLSRMKVHYATIYTYVEKERETQRTIDMKGRNKCKFE